MKIGILGLGSIGLRHARNLKMMGHEVAGYDPTAYKKLEAVVTTTLMKREELLTWSEAIVISTPTIQHYSDLIDCLEHKKPIFVEKPLIHRLFKDPTWGLDTKEFHDVFVGYMLRFHPVVKAAKQWIDAGNIGTPLWATFTCGQFNDKPDYLRDGVVLNWSHEIDLALYLLGPAKVFAASVRAVDGKDDIADFVLQHDSGARSAIHLDYVTKNEIREGWIVGSEKNIGLDLLGRNISFGKMVQKFGGDWNDDYMDEMHEFVSYAQMGKMTDLPVHAQWATGEDGLRVLEICHEVRKLAGLE